MGPETKILIIDDEKTNRVILRELVVSLGHTPITAMNGMYGLKVMDKELPDLVLLDINMPVMDGIEFLKHLQEEKLYLDVPVIVISAGIKGMDQVTQCIELGALDYVEKPINPTPLKARINACLERKNLRDKQMIHFQQLEEANAQIQVKNEALQQEIELRKMAEVDLKQAQELALENAHAAGMAEITGSILHNIGNTLNNLDVSWTMLKNYMRSASLQKMTKALALVQDHPAGMIDFLQNHPKGEILENYLISMGTLLEKERKEFDQEVRGITKKLILMKEVMRTQKMFARGEPFNQELDLNQVVEDCIQIQESFLRDHEIEIVKHLGNVPHITGQKTKLGQVILNLFLNAKEAMDDADLKQLNITTSYHDNKVSLSISDTGKGIVKKNQVKIFGHGYTTKRDRVGLGLHICATAMTEMGGNIQVESAPRKGATFILCWDKATVVENKRTEATVN